jgi:electron transfer flavoprotein alpha subunit
MRTLIIAEQEQGQLKPATLNAVTAAKQFNLPVDILIAGQDIKSIAEKLSQLDGVDKILVADSSAYAHGLAEPISELIHDIASHYSTILAPATTFGKNTMPRLAALLDVGQVSDVITIETPTRFVHPIYAGNALASVESLDSIRLLTVRTTAFSPAEYSDHHANIEYLSENKTFSKTQWVENIVQELERPELTAAEVIVAGGRGLGSAENFKLLEKLADKLNAAIGASRAAVDAGFVPNDMQVGQTGKVVAPKLYIAIGISGAIQHLAGMKDSKVIVAINKDPEAPIFKVADYGLVGDLFVILPELITAL